MLETKLGVLRFFLLTKRAKGQGVFVFVFVFPGLKACHMEVPRLEVELEW